MLRRMQIEGSGSNRKFTTEARDEFGLRGIAFGSGHGPGREVGLQLPLWIAKKGGGGGFIFRGFAPVLPHQRPDERRKHAARKDKRDQPEEWEGSHAGAQL